MTLEEFYNEIGGDYAGTKKRLMSDKIIKKFVLKFLNDPNYGELAAGMSKSDWYEAFKPAHTLIGVSLNMGYDRLGEAAAEFEKVVMPSNYKSGDSSRADYVPAYDIPVDEKEVQERFEAVKSAYEKIASLSSQLDA